MMSIREMEFLLAEAEEVLRLEQRDFVRLCCNVKRLKYAVEKADKSHEEAHQEALGIRRTMLSRRRHEGITRYELYRLFKKLGGFQDSIMLQYTKMHSDIWLKRQKKVAGYTINGSPLRYVIAKLLSYKKISKSTRCQLEDLINLASIIELDEVTKQFLNRLIAILVGDRNERRLYFELIDQGYSLYALNTDNPVAELVGAYPLDHVVKLQAYIEKHRKRLDDGVPANIVYNEMLKNPFQYLRFSNQKPNSLDALVNCEIAAYTNEQLEVSRQQSCQDLHDKTEWRQRTRECYAETREMVMRFDRILFDALLRQVRRAYYLYTATQTRHRMCFMERNFWHKKQGLGEAHARSFIERIAHIENANYLPSFSRYAEACQQFIYYFRQSGVKFRDHSFATYLLKVLFSDKQGLFARQFDGAPMSMLYLEQLEIINQRQVEPVIEEQPFGIVKQLSKETASSARCFSLFQWKATKERLVARDKAVNLIKEQQRIIKQGSDPA